MTTVNAWRTYQSEGDYQSDLGPIDHSPEAFTGEAFPSLPLMAEEFLEAIGDEGKAIKDTGIVVRRGGSDDSLIWSHPDLGTGLYNLHKVVWTDLPGASDSKAYLGELVGTEA